MKKHFCPRTYRGLSTGVMLAAGWLLNASLARATTPVTTTADSGPGSLRDAIANAPYYGTITFDPSVKGAITLTSGELGIIGDLTINGPGASILTVSGNNSSRVFNIAASATVTISGLTISSGFNQGADDSTGNNEPEGEGGGIINAGNLTLSNCTVINNGTMGGEVAAYGGDGLGGGIYSSKTLTLVNCLITQNSAYGGGGGEEFSGPGGFGGGVYSVGALAVTNCTVSENAAGGGGSFFSDFIEGGNGDGGGFYVSQMGLFANCTIVNNSASGGDGESTFATGVNAGDGLGGGLYFVNNDLNDNTALTLIITSCTISGNSCTGGAFNDPLLGSPGRAFGGGIYAVGNGAYGPYVTPTLNSTIVSGNAAVGGSVTGGLNGVATGPDVYADVVSGGFNLIGAADGSLGWIASGNGADLTGSTNAPLDAQLGQLQNNGGATPTMALASTSPAVDQGYSFGLATDQRGSPRPVDYLGLPYPKRGDGSDIGAFELVRPWIILDQINENLASLIKIFWNETKLNMATSPMMVSPPLYGVEVSPDPTFSQTMPSAMPVWWRNGRYELRDTIASTGAFYRLSTAVTNPFIPPATTTAATLITTNGATLNGTTTPYGLNTAYWFEYGADTNYGSSTITNVTLATSTNPASLSCAVGGLTPSTTYHFQLMVSDDDGTQLGGDQSFMTLSNAPATPPPTVVTLAASAVNSGGATLNGTVNPNGADTHSYYEYGTTTAYGNTTALSDVGTGNLAASLPYAIGGLAPNTLYHYQIVAYNSGGTQFGGDQSFTTLSPLLPVLVTQAATSVTSNSAVLNGTIEGNGSYGYAHFRYGTDTNYTGGEPVFTYYTTQSGDVEPYSYTLTGLTPGTTYHYQAFGFNCCAEGFGADQTFTTAPLAPTVGTLAASAVTQGTATLNGTVNPNGGASTAFFEWGTNANYGNMTTQTGIGTTPQSDFQASLSGLNSYTTYHYRIVATDAGGITYGADMNFTTAWTPVPPTLVSPGTSTPGGPTLPSLTPTFNWSAASQAASSDLILSKSPYGSGNVVFSAGVGVMSSYQIPSGFLQPGTAYAWYMVSFNSLGDESSQSSPLYFTTAAAPTVVTLPETNVVGTAYARLTGSVNPNGASTTVYFEYGTTTNYGTITTQTGIGTTTQIFSTTVNGLTADHIYHYRVDAVNGIGSSHGSDVAFVAP